MLHAEHDSKGACLPSSSTIPGPREAGASTMRSVRGACTSVDLGALFPRPQISHPVTRRSGRAQQTPHLGTRRCALRIQIQMHLYLYLYLYGTTSRPLGESRIPFDGPFLCCCGNRLERGAVWLTLGAHVLFPPSELNSGCAGGARVCGRRFVAPWWRSSEGPAGGWPSC